jgi:hypothetical protein
VKAGDRVTLTGRVTFVSADSKGVGWVMVTLDGEPAHSIACWVGNVTEVEEARPRGNPADDFGPCD